MFHLGTLFLVLSVQKFHKTEIEQNGILNNLLAESSKYLRENLITKLPNIKRNKNYNHERVDWMGKKLNGKDLRGVNFKGAYLIAADMKYTDLSDANLSTSMFLTQMQINSAKGNAKTLLPLHIQRPLHWN